MIVRDREGKTGDNKASKRDKWPKFISARRPLLRTLGARGFSYAVPGVGQVFKSDPREKPVDQSAIPLKAPSQ